MAAASLSRSRKRGATSSSSNAAIVADTSEASTFRAQTQAYERKHEDMCAADMLYDLVGDREEVKLRRVLLGVHAYIRRRFELEYNDEQSAKFRDYTDSVFLACAQTTRDMALREVRLAVVFERLAADGSVRAYFCEPGVTDATLDPARTHVDPGAFASWVLTYLVPYTDDLYNGAKMDIPTYTQSAWTMYAALRHSAPDTHPRTQALRRRHHHTNTHT